MSIDQTSTTFSPRLLSWLLIFLTLSAGYLFAFPQPTILYAGIVILHVLAGILVTVLLFVSLLRWLRSGGFLARAGWLLTAGGALMGIILIKTGTARPELRWLYIHIGVSLVGVGLLAAEWLGRRGWLAGGFGSAATRAALCLVIIGVIAYGARHVRESWQTRNRIENPAMPAESMNGEGDG